MTRQCVVVFINHAADVAEYFSELANNMPSFEKVVVIFESDFAFNLFGKKLSSEIDVFVLSDPRKLTKKKLKRELHLTGRDVNPEIDRKYWWCKHPLGALFRANYRLDVEVCESYVFEFIHKIEKLEDQFDKVYVLYEPQSTLINNAYFRYFSDSEIVRCVGLRKSKFDNFTEVHWDKKSLVQQVKCVKVPKCTLSDREIESFARTPPLYFRVNRSRRWRIKDRLHYVKWFTISKYSIQIGVPLITLVNWFISNRYKNFRSNFYLLMSKFFVKNIPTDNYYVYPMHVHPEASTSVEAFGWHDDVNLIFDVLAACSLHAKLVVRLHPNGVGNLSFREYFRLITNRRIVLSVLDNQYEVIKNSRGVITLGGTLGLEAVRYRIPTYCLTNNFLVNLAHATYVPNISDLHHALSTDAFAEYDWQYEVSKYKSVLINFSLYQSTNGDDLLKKLHLHELEHIHDSL